MAAAGIALVNGTFKCESHFHGRARGNLICFEGPNKRFIDDRCRKHGETIHKRGKYDNCSALGLTGDRVTMYAPQGASNTNFALTRRIKSVWP